MKNTTLTILNVRHNNLGTLGKKKQLFRYSYSYFYSLYTDYCLGGEILVEAMKKNRTLKELCIVDNKVGSEIAVAIAARLQGSALAIMRSFKYDQLVIPNIHAEKEKVRISNKLH